MTNTKLLTELIAESGYKRNYIASQLGITTYALSKKINNVNEFKASEIQVLCNVLNIADADMKESIFFAV